VIADESGLEQTRELREGEVLLLGREYRYVYGGESRIEWRSEDDILEVNGQVVGMILDGVPSQQVVEQHQGALRSIRVRGSGALTPGLVEAVEALAGERLVLELEWIGERPHVERLASLDGRLRGLWLGDSASTAENVALEGAKFRGDPTAPLDEDDWPEALR
jgi:hypothetical protein